MRLDLAVYQVSALEQRWGAATWCLRGVLACLEWAGGALFDSGTLSGDIPSEFPSKRRNRFSIGVMIFGKARLRRAVAVSWQQRPIERTECPDKDVRERLPLTG